METSEKLTEQQSLQIINDMIAAAKNNVKADAFIFLLWGWLVFVASLGEFIMLLIGIKNPGWVWLLMPLGAVVTVIYVIKKRHTEKTKTYTNHFMKYIWIAFTVALFIIIAFSAIPALQIMPCIIILYGIGLFISGGALQFKPLILGGVFCWLCAIVGFQVQNEYILLVIAAAVLGGYIIPGYLLKQSNKNNV